MFREDGQRTVNPPLYARQVRTLYCPPYLSKSSRYSRARRLNSGLFGHARTAGSVAGLCPWPCWVQLSVLVPIRTTKGKRSNYPAEWQGIRCPDHPYCSGRGRSTGRVSLVRSLFRIVQQLNYCDWFTICLQNKPTGFNSRVKNTILYNL